MERDLGGIPPAGTDNASQSFEFPADEELKREHERLVLALEKTLDVEAGLEDALNHHDQGQLLKEVAGRLDVEAGLAAALDSRPEVQEVRPDRTEPKVLGHGAQSGHRQRSLRLLSSLGIMLHALVGVDQPRFSSWRQEGRGWRSGRAPVATQIARIRRRLLVFRIATCALLRFDSALAAELASGRLRILELGLWTRKLTREKALEIVDDVASPATKEKLAPRGWKITSTWLFVAASNVGGVIAAGGFAHLDVTTSVVGGLVIIGVSVSLTALLVAHAIHRKLASQLRVLRHSVKRLFDPSEEYQYRPSRK